MVTYCSFTCRSVKSQVNCCCVKLSAVVLSTCSASGSQKCRRASLSALSVPQVQYWVDGKNLLSNGAVCQLGSLQKGLDQLMESMGNKWLLALMAL